MQEIVLRPSKAQDAFLNFVRAGDDLASDNVDLNKIFPVKPIHVNRWKDLAPSVRKSIISDLLRLTVLSAHVYPYKITRAAIMKVSAVHGAKDLSLQYVFCCVFMTRVYYKPFWYLFFAGFCFGSSKSH